jgi:hypothetical protein
MISISIVDLLEDRYNKNCADLKKARQENNDYLVDVINNAQSRILQLICTHKEQEEKNEAQH